MVSGAAVGGGSGGSADMASGGACGSRSSSPADRRPPPFPEPHGGDSDAPGAADSDTEGEDIFTGTVSAGGEWGEREPRG